MNRPRAYIIMSLDPQQKGIYDAVIKTTFEELNWECRRIDELPWAGNSVRQMVWEIAAATLVVADLTLVVPTPAPHPATAEARAGVPAGGADLHHIGQRGHRRGDQPGRRGAIAEPAKGVGPPTGDVTPGPQRA